MTDRTDRGAPKETLEGNRVEPLDIASVGQLPAPVPWNPIRGRAALQHWKQLFGEREEASRSGRAVFLQGDQPEHVFVLSSGLAMLTCNTADGREAIVALRFPGQVLDCCCHDLGIRYPVSARTIAPSMLYRVTVTAFRSRATGDPDTQVFLDHLLRLDAYNAATSIAALKIASPAERLERFLRYFAGATGQVSDLKSAGIFIPLRDCHLAQIIGLSYRHFARVKKELQAAGRIHLTRANRFVLRK